MNTYRYRKSYNGDAESPERFRVRFENSAVYLFYNTNGVFKDIKPLSE